MKIKDLEGLILANKTENTSMQEKLAQELMELERDIDDLRGRSWELEGKQEKKSNHDVIS